MEKKAARRTIVVLSLVLLTVVGLTYLISFLIKGYRPTINQNRFGFLPTGLLVANSDPEGASVYINDKLATATDDTVSLPPDEYSVRIEKDGYLPWFKTLTIQKEIVTQTNALLFRSTPDLKPLTSTGAIKPTLSSDGGKIVYGVTNSASAEKNGIWVLDLASNLPLNRANNRQISGAVNKIDWETAIFIWSPDNKEVLLINQESEKITGAYLVPTDKYTSGEKLVDASIRLTLILEEWQKEQREELKLKIAKLPKEMVEVATVSAKMVNFSSDGERFFYLAKEAVKIPENLIPHPPARSTQPEEREIRPGNIYVYDIKQDINFLISSAESLGVEPQKPAESGSLDLSAYQPQAPSWLTNNHLVYIDQGKKEVKVVESDGTNIQTIYSGPFNNGFIFPSPSSRSLIVLTSLHPDSPGNLYEIRVR
ncbi:MAG: PEGA domain-containing protein [Patescibacteria group bacterium]